MQLSYRWVIVAVGALMTCVALGAMFSLAVFGEFYMLAAIFGTAYGGVMPFYAVLAHEYFGQQIMGTVFGAATMLSSIGMAFGPLAGGWVFDTFDAYSWLFIGSFGWARCCRRGAGLPPIAVEPEPTAAAGLTNELHCAVTEWKLRRLQGPRPYEHGDHSRS